MCRQIRLGLVPGLVAATLLAWGCDRPVTPAGPKPSFSDGTGLCAGGERFTGGGRIEPLGGTTTFGFNVDARDLCSSGGPIKGQLQTVWHPPHLRIQSLTFDPSSFASFEDLDGRGVRVLRRNGEREGRQWELEAGTVRRHRLRQPRPLWDRARGWEYN